MINLKHVKANPVLNAFSKVLMGMGLLLVILLVLPSLFFVWLQVTLLSVSLLLMGVGIIDLMFACGMRDAFRKDRSGLAWQIAVFLALIIAVAVAYFIAGYPADIVYNSITDFYTFTGITKTAIDMVRIFISVIVGVALFLGIIWLWVNSNRKGVYM